LHLGSPGVQDAPGQRREVDWFSPVEPGLSSGESEQGLDDSLLLGAGGEDLLVGSAQRLRIGVWVGQRYLDERPLPGQRGTQPCEALATNCRCAANETSSRPRRSSKVSAATRLTR
jgi:hypothetical protein